MTSMNSDMIVVPEGNKAFTLHRCIGRGGFGEVFQATMVREGVSQEVAVKLLHSGIDPDSQAVKRMRDEGRLLSYLRHDNILRSLDMLVLNGRLALVTEYIPGEDLSTSFEATPPMSPRALVEVVGRVAAALDAAWNSPSPEGKPLKLVHRDVKPSNIRIGRGGEVKLLDFGLAMSDEVTREAQTQAHALVGSLLYMAPERYLQKPPTVASDVFSLGCCLYEGLTSQRMFQGKRPVDLYMMLLEPGEWDRYIRDRMLDMPSTVPAEVRQLVTGMLSREPSERPTASALAAQWRALAERTPGASLAGWASKRLWPDVVPVDNHLEGSVVTVAITHPERSEVDLTFARQATVPRGLPAPAPPPLPRAQVIQETGSDPRVPWLIAGLMVMTTTTVGLLILLALISTGYVWTQYTPPSAPAQAIPVAVGPSTRVLVDGVRGSELRRGRVRQPPGPVSPGTWQLWVDFGEGLVKVGSVSVGEGDTLRVRCAPGPKTCDLPR